LTSFSPFGVTEIDASTKRFVAGPLPTGPLLPPAAVVRFTVAVFSGVAPSVNTMLTLAFATNVAGVGLFTFNVQV